MAYLPSGRLNANITGNTAGASSLLTAGTMYLAGGNNVTLSQNGSTISFNAAGAAQASVNFSASNASANLASVNFINSNNVSFGLTNGSQVFGSASFAQSVQTQNNIQALGAGASTAATGTVVFGNANGVGFGMNGQTITASYTTPPAASNVIGASGGNVSGNVGTINSSNFSYVFAGGNNITLSQSITSNSATLSISGPSFANANNVTLGISNNGVVTGSASFAQSAQTQNVIQGIQAAGSLNTSGTISFANSNNVAFGLSNGTMTASYTAGSNAFGVSGGNNVNSSVVSGSNAGLVLAGGNNITLSQSVSGGSLAQVTVSGPSLANANGFAFGTNAGNVTASYTGAGFINLSASGSVQNLSALSFANSNAITFGLSNGTITASAAPDGIQGISAGAASTAGGVITFSNANNINFGLTNGVMTASANVAGGGIAIGANANTFSTGTLGLNAGGALTLSTAAQSLTISAPATSNIVGVAGISLSTNGSTISISNAVSIPRWEYPKEGFNTLVAPALNGTLSLQHIFIPANLTVSSAKIGGLVSVGSSGAAGNASYNLSLWMGLYTLNGSTLNLSTSGSAANNFSFLASNSGGSSTALTGVTGFRQLTVPMTMNLTPGDYWVGAVVSSITSSVSAGLTLTPLGNPNFGTASAMILTPMGSNSTAAGAARDVILFQGFHSAQTVAGPAQITGSLINNTALSAAQRAAFYHAFYSTTY